MTSVNGFVVGQPALVDGEVRTVSAVGTQGRNTTLAAAAAAGDTVVKVASVNGFVAGDTLIVDTGAAAETRTIAAVGTAGADGTGVTLTAALSAAHASGVAARMQGTGITFETPLAAAHAQGAATRGLGTGITITPALADSHAAGAAITTPGSGITLAAPLAKAHAAGAAIVGPVPTEFCRPSNNAQLSGHLQGGPARAAAAQVVHRRAGLRARRRRQRARVLVRPGLERDDAQRDPHVGAHVPGPRLHELRQDRPVHDRRRHVADPSERVRRRPRT